MNYQRLKKPFQSKQVLRCIDVAVIALTIGAASYGGLQLFSNGKDVCKVIGTRHELQLKDSNFTTPHLTVQRCDIVTVIDLDTQEYSLNFGTHENLVDYPGFQPQILASNESINIAMIASGTYELHDHLRNTAQVELFVRP